MPVNTQTVTFAIFRPDGQPETRRIRFELVTGSYDETGMFPAHLLRVSPDANGEGEVELWANEGGVEESYYLCELPSGESFRFSVPTSGGPFTLSELRELGVTITDPQYPTFRSVLSMYHVRSYGALGDGTTDDIEAFEDAIDDASDDGGGVVMLDADATYRLTRAPIVSAGVRINLNRSTIVLNFPTELAGYDLIGFDIRDYAGIYNGTIRVQAVGNPTGGSDKSLHSNICVGLSGGNLAGYKGWRVADLVLENNRSTADLGGTCILVQADSHDGVIENIEFPDSTTVGGGIRIHWAGDGDSPPAITKHPYNIDVRNIRFGAMTFTGTLGDICGVDVVAAYNVSVVNVHADRWKGDALVQARAGAYGRAYADADIQPLLFQNITFAHITAQLCDNRLALANAVSHDEPGTPLNSMPVTFRKCKGVGPGGAIATGGIEAQSVADVTIEDCEAEQFRYGVHIGERAKQITVRRGRYHHNTENGCVTAHATTPPEDVLFDQVESYLNGTSGSGFAGFYAEQATRITYRDCIAGDATSETTQSYGFRATTGATVRFEGVNRVRNIKVGGAKYLFDVAVDTDFFFSGGTIGTLATGSTEYAPIMGLAAPAAAEVDASLLVRPTLFLCNFQVKLSAAPNGATKSRTLRIVDDGGVTNMLATITDAATTGSYLDAIEVAAGSEVSVQSTVANTPDAARGKWTVQAIRG